MKLKHLILSLAAVCVLSFTGAALVFHSTDLLAGDSSTTFQVDEKKEVSLTGISAVEITGQVAADVDIKTSTSDRMTAHFYGTISSNADVKKPEMRVEKKNDVLIITLEQDRDWRKKLLFNAKFRSELKLDIVLPNEYAGTLNIQTASGDVGCTGYSGKALEVQTASGDVDVSDFQGSMLSTSTASGDIVVREVKADRLALNTASGDVSVVDGTVEKLRTRTASGDIHVRSVSSTELESRSASGDVLLEELSGKSFSFGSTSGELSAAGITAEEMSLSTTSGDIRIKGASGNLRVSSTSGEVKAEILEFPMRVSCSTTSGDISMVLPKGKPYSFQGSTNGDIYFKGPGGKVMKAERKLYVQCDGCDQTVKIKSTSGDIDVR